jgi:hypothetical protein
MVERWGVKLVTQGWGCCGMSSHNGDCEGAVDLGRLVAVTALPTNL